MTTNLGFGAAPMGSTPFGFGQPGAILSSGPRPLLRLDGTLGDCALLDTTTGDFVLDADGNKIGWIALDQQVYMRLRNKIGTLADATVGIDLPSGGNITPDLADRNRNAVEIALAPLVSAGLIAIVDVVTIRIPGHSSAVSIDVTWRDVSGGDEEKLTTVPASAF